MDEYYLIGIGIIVILISIVSIYFIVEYFVKFNINKIYEYPNMLSDEQINEIIKIAEPLVKPSPVIGPGGKNVQMNDIRTSHQVFLPDKYPVVQDIYNKLSNIIGIDKDHFEQLQVVRYHPGQLYKEHWDACWEEDKCQDFLKRGGNRYATFLLYLNDDFDEGETYFPLRNKKITLPEHPTCDNLFTNDFRLRSPASRQLIFKSYKFRSCIILIYIGGRFHS